MLHGTYPATVSCVWFSNPGASRRCARALEDASWGRDLAPAPRDTLVGALLRSWKRALAGLCARLEAGETSSCGLAKAWILSMDSAMAATRGLKSAVEKSWCLSETVFMINSNWWSLLSDGTFATCVITYNEMGKPLFAFNLFIAKM